VGLQEGLPPVASCILEAGTRAVITRRELERWLLREGAVRVKRADGHKHFNLRGHHVVVLGHGPQTLSATSVSLVMKQLEQAGYRRENLRRQWSGA